MSRKAWSALARIPWWVRAIALVAFIPRMRLLREAIETHPDQLATYEALLGASAEVARIDDEDARSDWHLYVHDVAEMKSEDATP